MRDGAISCDVDTLAAIYRGHGLRRTAGYTAAEFRMGLENFCRFLEPFGISATLFMVGQDFHQPQSIPYIRSAAAQGHEVANHTLTHVQGFRFLSPEAKEAEIAGMEEACEKVLGVRPLGFRAPGWNTSDDAAPILRRRGYLYDASVFPSWCNPLLKWLHRRATRARTGGDRTTLGPLRYMFAPPVPYRTRENRLGRRGRARLIEFPVTVVPVLRVPFFATMLLTTGWEFFRLCYQLIRARGWSIQYQFHLSDFVDYAHPDLEGQVPDGAGVYVPRALTTPLARKWDLFRKALALMAADYKFGTLESWSRTFPAT